MKGAPPALRRSCSKLSAWSDHPIDTQAITPVKIALTVP